MGVTEAMVTAAVPVLVKTMVCAREEVFTNCAPKISCAVLRDAPGARPVPSKEAVCVPRLSEKFRLPVSAPATVGA